MDDFDLKILNMLLNNPDINQKEIASKLGMTPPAITHRIRRMRKEGAMIGFSPVVDLKKLDFDLTILTCFKVKYDLLKEATRWLARDRNTCAVFFTTGVYDILTISKFKNTKEFNDWVERINRSKELPNFINRMNSSFVFYIGKEGIAPSKVR